MKASLSCVLFIALISAPVKADTRLTSESQSLVLTHVTVIDGTGAPAKPDMTVVIKANRISEVGKAGKVEISNGVRIVDATGKYLIPGLWDMHVHLSYYGESALSMLVANGVTSVRDMGGDLNQIDEWRNEIAQGDLLGPRIIRAGPFVVGPTEISAFRASLTSVVTTVGEARRLVVSLKQQGVDFIKIHSRISRNAFFAVADEASKQDIPFVCHLPQHVTAVEASAAGARSIEHTESFLESAIYIETEKEREKSIEDAFTALNSAEGAARFARLRKDGTRVVPTLISLYRVLADSGTAFEKEIPSKLLRVVAALHQERVIMMAGSDFASEETGIRPGFDLHEELVLLTEAGLTPMEALQAATREPAKFLDLLDSLGEVKKGKIADLVLLDANPLEDIRNSRRIAAVIVDGKLLPKESLKQLVTDAARTGAGVLDQRK